MTYLYKKHLWDISEIIYISYKFTNKIGRHLMLLYNKKCYYLF